MRVEAVEMIPKTTEEATPLSSDAVSLAVKNFLAAIESDDSLFLLLEPIERLTAEGASNGRVLSGDVALGFKEGDLRRERSLQFLVVEKLIELLKEAGSKEKLEAKLCLAASKEDANQKGNALYIRLAAIGDSLEQAALRWGLGLTHLQQALLFTSRHMRMHLTRAPTKDSSG